MKNYSFIDMHVHTAYSDEELCDMSIPELLAMAQKRASKVGKDCVIAIADHNTILGVQEARMILNSAEGKAKYPNVKLINGIEFTTDLVEVCDLFDGKRVFTRCHTLAYGYDENDSELTAYSRITHKFFTTNDNVGMQICAARRAVCEHYKIDIPFTALEELASMNRNTNFRKEFIKLVQSYVEKNQLSVNLSNINSVVAPYISTFVEYNREASAKGRLKLSDIAKLIKNAGGELVIAHPALIKVTVDGLNRIAENEGLSLSDVYIPGNRKYNNNTDLAHVRRQKLVFEYFIDSFNKICSREGITLSGIERYYSSNYSSRLDRVIETICAEQGMYETCGSDYHGLHLHPSKSLGDVFGNDIQKNYKGLFEHYTESRVPIVVSGLSAVEYLIDKVKPSHNTALFSNDKGEEISMNDVIYSIQETNNREHIRENQSETALTQEEQMSTLGIGERISELLKVTEKFNDIIERSDSKAKQAKLLLRLNLFVENIYEPLKVLRDKAESSLSIRQDRQYRQLCELMKNIKRQFNQLLTNNPRMIKDLKSDMKYYYKQKKVLLHRLAELDFAEPLKVEPVNVESAETQNTNQNER